MKWVFLSKIALHLRGKGSAIASSDNQRLLVGQSKAVCQSNKCWGEDDRCWYHVRSASILLAVSLISKDDRCWIPCLTRAIGWDFRKQHLHGCRYLLDHCRGYLSHKISLSCFRVKAIAIEWNYRVSQSKTTMLIDARLLCYLVWDYRVRESKTMVLGWLWL